MELVFAGIAKSPSTNKQISAVACMAPIARATLFPSVFVTSTTITFSRFTCLIVSISAPFATIIISSTPAFLLLV